MKKTMWVYFFCLIILGIVVVFSAPNRSNADTIFTWSGMWIVGERSDFYPSGSAVFGVSGTTLTIILTNDTSQEIRSIGEALSGLTWTITDPGVSLTPQTALVAPGSSLVPGTYTATDLSGEWAFRSNLSAGSSYSGPLGSFGIGAVGDINLGVDTFGRWDLFNTSSGANLFGPRGPNGIEAAIIGFNVDLTADGFPNPNNQPVVQNQMIFTFLISGNLSENEITNVQPLFGTDGATLVPEPGTLILLGSGLLGAGILGRRKLFYRNKN